MQQSSIKIKLASKLLLFLVVKNNKKPWPTKAAMEQIYTMRLWGSNAAKFYSGEGSHNPAIVNPYLELVQEFLLSFKDPITVCDLGCGDFNIGKNLVKYTQKYIAVDIVKTLIDYNRKIFKEPNVEFFCLDIAKDNLPTADCVIIRQVLQHLSNEEVVQIVKKIKNYKYIILTEHVPKGDFIPNKNIISGQGIRLKKQSGINLLAPPFDLKITSKKELFMLSLEKNKGEIQTVLYEL